jgi:hypothetical protein
VIFIVELVFVAAVHRLLSAFRTSFCEGVRKFVPETWEINPYM